MPIFEYRCADCDAVIEVFQQPSDPSPRLCGYRCPLPREDPRDCRGFGALERILSPIGGHVRSAVAGDHPGVDQALRHGLSVYENTGRGARKIGGKGPDFVPADEG